MSKLRRDLRIALAGGGCGLFGVSVFLLAERVDAYYAYVRWLQETHYAGTYYRAVEDLWWIPVTFWHVVLSIIASFLMHRYLASDRVSPFLRWQAIGLVALVGWGITGFGGIGMVCLSRGTISPIEEIGDHLGQLISVAQFVAAVFASNVLYGTAVQAAYAQDTREDTQVRGSQV